MTHFSLLIYLVFFRFCEIKLDKLNQEMERINQRLVNKNFVEKAPTELIDQEKTNFNNLEKDVKKIQLTLENL